MGLIYVMLLGFMFLLGTGFGDPEYTHWREIKDECEKSLPKDKYCVLYAKPEESILNNSDDKTGSL